MKHKAAPARENRYQALLQLLATADSIWDASRIFFDAWELTPSQFNVLNLLRGHPAGLSQTELGRRLITHRSNVTGLTDRLEKRELVVRKEVAGDRRAYRVVLTAEGAELLEKILPEYYAQAEALWDRVPPDRLSDFTRELQALAANAQKAAAGLPKKPE